MQPLPIAKRDGTFGGLVGDKGSAYFSSDFCLLGFNGFLLLLNTFILKYVYHMHNKACIIKIINIIILTKLHGEIVFMECS